MITQRNIVCIASSWFDHPTSKHHMMRRLARDNQVLWVSFHGSRTPRLSGADAGAIARRIKQAFRGRQQVLPQLDVISPVVLPMPRSRLVRWMNSVLLTRHIRAALRTYPKRPTQLWLFTPDVPSLIPQLRTECTLYYCVDEFGAFAGYNAERIERLERATVSRSDLVVTTSDALQTRLKDTHPIVKPLPHGVDVDHFAPTPERQAEPLPEDVADLDGTVFGYFGLISEWVDQQMIVKLARARRDATIVLLGRPTVPIEALEAEPNIRLLGPKPYATLPAYCRAFDVALIPFEVSRLTHATNPIKLREYLAAGLPVASTPMPEVSHYAPHVFIGDTPEAYLEAVAQAERHAGATPRTEIARSVAHESWDHRLDRLSEWVLSARRLSHALPGDSAGRLRAAID